MASQDQPILSAKGRRLAAGQHLLGMGLDRAASAEPLYQQIRAAVRSAVLAGSLGPGFRLPPERELAIALRVNRSTVTRAYQELAADGLVEPQGSRGTVVVTQDAGPLPMIHGQDGATEPGWLLGLPALGKGALGPDPTLLSGITAAGGREGVISFAAAAPAPHDLPVTEMQRALALALDRWGPRALNYGPVEGFGPLLVQLRDRLGAGPNVMVVSGATQGLDLAARTLIEPDDEVAVEAPTFPGILQTFGLAGARLVGVPVDSAGMRVDLLEGLLARRNIRLIVVQPTYHNPTGAVMSPPRRDQLLVLARRHGVPILEDDPYAMLTLEGDDPGTLISRDRHSLVVHIGSFSKTVTPGLRVGWMSAPAPVLARLAVVKQFADLNSSLLGQAILAQLIESGSYHSHVERMLPHYRQRRDALVQGLAELNGRLTPTAIPRGGFHLWCRVEAGPVGRLLAAAAAQEGVAVVPGEAFHPSHSLRGETGTGHVRLSFSEVAPASIREGVRRLGLALDSLPDSRATGGSGSRIVV